MHASAAALHLRATAPRPAHVPTDGELIDAIAERDESGLATLYDRYHRLAFTLALRIVDDRGRAEDVVQDAYLSVWRRAASYARARGTVKTWLSSIVRNRAIDVVRSRRESVADDEATLRALHDPGPSVLEQVTSNLERDAVRSVVAELPEVQRQAIAMAYFEGRSHTEIAEVTGTPLGTVKSRIRLGMERLRHRVLAQRASAPDRPMRPRWVSRKSVGSVSP